MGHYQCISLAHKKPTARLANRVALDHQTLPASHRCLSKSDWDHQAAQINRAIPLSLAVVSDNTQWWFYTTMCWGCYVTIDIFLLKKMKWFRIWNFFYSADDCDFICIISFSGYFLLYLIMIWKISIFTTNHFIDCAAIWVPHFDLSLVLLSCILMRRKSRCCAILKCLSQFHFLLSYNSYKVEKRDFLLVHYICFITAWEYGLFMSVEKIITTLLHSWCLRKWKFSSFK